MADAAAAAMPTRASAPLGCNVGGSMVNSTFWFLRDEGTSMFNVQSQLAVQSYCYRNFKAVDALIGQIKALGLKRTELCAVHADFGNEAGFEGVLSQFKNAGIQIA